MKAMKSIMIVWYSALILSTVSIFAQSEKKIVVTIPSYNNKEWFEKNLLSVFLQKYTNYHVIYIDDCSNDGTYEAIKDFVEKYSLADKITLIQNEKRVGALANHYKAVHMCDDHDIIVQLDGDDWLAHDRVLQKVNETYQDSSIWMAYSQFVHLTTNVQGWNRRLSKREIDLSTNRGSSPSHLRTFYAALFKKIKVEDFMYEGDFLQMTCDMAMMLPMVEMARNNHIKFIPEILYIYNDSNPINDHRINKGLQRILDEYIRTLPRYPELDHLFTN